MSRRPIYLDYNATTPCDPLVIDTMWPYFREHFGNAASQSHVYGWEAKAAVRRARTEVAALIGAADAQNIIWTSGATESNNTVIHDALTTDHRTDNRANIHIITQKTEHASVLDPCRSARRHGARVTYLNVDAHGRVNPDDLRLALTPDTVLVSIMAANNETGTLQDIPALAHIVHTHSPARFHCDAAQAAGKIPIDVAAWDVDLLSLSAHKFYGPKGIGALYVARRRPPLSLTPLLLGGGHERGLRSGTPAVPLIVGMGKAASLLLNTLQEDATRLKSLRDAFTATILSEIPEAIVNGDPRHTLPNTVNISFPSWPSSTLLSALSELALSSGSACQSGENKPSHVILALGRERRVAEASLRFCLGRPTTADQMTFAAQYVVEKIRSLRHLPSP